MGIQIDEDKQELYTLLQCPDGLVGRKFSQKWSDDEGVEMWWTGIIRNRTEGEFCHQYDRDEKT